jgi:prefoldin subunit 2
MRLEKCVRPSRPEARFFFFFFSNWQNDEEERRSSGPSPASFITPICAHRPEIMSEITEEKAPAAKQDDPASEKEVINTFQTLRQEASQLFSKINELENEKAEHALVIDAIKDLDPKRKCFRLIGGVLVERTVEEVLPAVQKNTDGLSAVIEKLTQQRDDKVDRVEYLQKKYKIRVRGEEAPEDEENDGEAGKQGVLA